MQVLPKPVPVLCLIDIGALVSRQRTARFLLNRNTSLGVISMPKLSIRDIDLANKRVFIRVDFNVPLTEDGSMITDDTRIVATLPTIVYALQKRAKVILASHLGRPKGKPNPKYSLRPVVDRLRELLDK
jgi:hypothetical protein